MLGIGAAAAVWDDPGVDWDAFDLVLPRSTWDYAERRDAFLDWAASVPRVLNPLPVLEWNTDKERYLTDLAGAGVPVVPTTLVPPGGDLDPQREPFVVKPAISAGGRSSARFEAGQEEDARALVARIHGEGRTAMVQPFLGENGETALVFLDGRHSHAVRRRVPLPGGGGLEVFYLDEELAPVNATGRERGLAETALAATGASDLLYARVDLMDGLVLEVELTEPSLYLAYCEGAAARFAEAVGRRL